MFISEVKKVARNHIIKAENRSITLLASRQFKKSHTYRLKSKRAYINYCIINKYSKVFF